MRLSVARRLLYRSSILDGEETLAQAYLRKSLEMEADRYLLLSACIVAGAAREAKDVPSLSELDPPRNPDYARALIEIFSVYHGWYDSRHPEQSAEKLMQHAMACSPAREFLEINAHNDVLWYDRDRYGDFVFWMYMLGLLHEYSCLKGSEDVLFLLVGRFFDTRNKSEYRVDRLLEYLERLAG